MGWGGAGWGGVGRGGAGRGGAGRGGAAWGGVGCCDARVDLLQIAADTGVASDLRELTHVAILVSLLI